MFREVLVHPSEIAIWFHFFVGNQLLRSLSHAFHYGKAVLLVKNQSFFRAHRLGLRVELEDSFVASQKVVDFGKIMDALTAHLRRESGNPKGMAGAVAFMQRFGSGANLNVHLHIIALDGTYSEKSTNRLKFYNAKAPTAETTERLASDIAKRINKHLVKKGYLEQSEDLMLVGNTEDLFSSANDNLHLPAQAASASHRIAFGQNAGTPVRRLRSSHALWPSEDDVEVSSTACISVGGYSVHAATAVKSDERDRLEKLFRYLARPAIAEDGISILPNGDIKLKLKTPWRDGSEFLLFTPTEFLEKLVALVPLPKFHLTRYYGVFSPASPHRKNLPDRPSQNVKNTSETTDAEAPHKSRSFRQFRTFSKAAVKLIAPGIESTALTHPFSRRSVFNFFNSE